ncbi:MAG: uroporphyrinogen-III synthase [Burkholderiales bacterium PBB1]|nr:MAG: uroporphyrinogen-III synthase [Burkholderiales bacterium PBB1]
MRIIVTRPAAQATPWVQSLAQHGLHAAALPLIEIVPTPDTAAVTAAWQQLADARLVMFVSANAVEHFFALRPPQAAWPPHTQAAAPGPGTTRALQDAGVPISQIVEPAPDSAQFDSEALWQVLRLQDWQGAAVQVVRGDGGRDWLADTLREHGARVGFVSAYRRSAPRWDNAAQSLLADALAQPADHLWFFSSSEAIDHLMARLDERALALPAGAKALATHPRIAARATTAGFSPVWQSLPTLPEVVACIQSIAL